MACVRRVVAGLSLRRPGDSPRPSRVGFVLDKVALERVFGRILRYFSASFILPALRVHSFVQSPTLFGLIK
jgi:hypothetical protein